MITIIEVLYWTGLGALLYPYLAYPILLWLLVRIRGGYQPESRSDDYLPSVTLMISAYNESAVIDGKLENARSLDYPADKLQIVVVSDASSDGTDELVQEHAAKDPRVVLYRQQEQQN